MRSKNNVTYSKATVQNFYISAVQTLIKNPLKEADYLLLTLVSSKLLPQQCPTKMT